MPDSLDHGKLVLGTILAHQSREALGYALRYLEPDHFTDSVQRNLWVMTERYMDQAGHVLTRSAVEDGLRGQPPGTSLMYLEYFDAVVKSAAAKSQAGLASFKWSVGQLRELAAERMTGEAMAQGMEILRRGVRENGRELTGHADARSWLAAKFSEIDRSLRHADAPEGDVRHEGGEVLQEYGTRKGMAARGESGSISTGFPGLDKELGGGLERGEMAFVAAWTSAGKTSTLVHLTWRASVIQGRNVVYFTSETLRPQIRVKLMARHSREEKFGLPHGLNSRDIKSGQLTPAAEQKLAEVVDDFSSISGRVYLAQMPKGASISVIDGALDRITRDWAADLVILDSVQLLRPEFRTARRSGWEDSSDTIKAAKELAATYKDGRGVPVVSPWQVSKEGRRRALERGYYLLEDLSESPEARNAPDVVMSLWTPPDFVGGRDVSLEMSLLKNRDGAARYGAGNTFRLRTDYATSYFVEQASGADSVSSLMDFQGGDFGAAG
jgi:replicative DNA helicase